MAIEISEVIMRAPGAEFNGLAINNPDQLSTSPEGNYTVNISTATVDLLLKLPK